MFSGIVEATAPICGVETKPSSLQITIQRPSTFSDLHRGDSVCVNGVCLTLEQENGDGEMIFTLGPETLKITGWSAETLTHRYVNLERSLRFGDRIHGHLVAGHVDGVGLVEKVDTIGTAVVMEIKFPPILGPFVWRKGSVAVNGVSLTLNAVHGETVELCLIPETLKRTNLGECRPGDRVNLEVDGLARAMVRHLELAGAERCNEYHP